METPSNGNSKAVTLLVGGLLTGGGGTSLLTRGDKDVEERAKEIVNRNEHYYQTAQLVQGMENIRIRLDRCLADRERRRRASAPAYRAVDPER